MYIYSIHARPAGYASAYLTYTVDLLLALGSSGQAQ
jgi:hypothetical protein